MAKWQTLERADPKQLLRVYQGTDPLTGRMGPGNFGR